MDPGRGRIGAVLLALAAGSFGCTDRAGPTGGADPTLAAIAEYSRRNSEAAQARAAPCADEPRLPNDAEARWRSAPPLLALLDDPAAPATQASRTDPSSDIPADYWRRDAGRQIGYEMKDFVKRGLWHGFKTAYWDLDNLLVLTATMGASVTIRATGVDDAINRRTDGNRALGSDWDETIQIIGNPGTHFAAASLWWLTSTLQQDVKQHEVARTMLEALTVNGISTLLLKASANTRTEDGERHGWPSGHTSSAFTVAAVVNEYYGPWAGVPSLAMAGLVGYQRIDSRVHDFSDVVFGGMLGYIIGTSIAADEKAKFPELFGMKVIPYSDPQTGAAGLALFKQY
jgi:membrane-associated phospholipid phosphatase